MSPQVMLDYDTLCAIIEQADFDTLKTLSVVNKDICHRAARRLWRCFTIATRTPPSRRVARSNLERAISIISNRDRLPYLRDLRIHIWASLGPDDGPESEAVLRKLFDLIDALTLLSTLEVVAYNHQSRVVSKLAEQSILIPDLTRLSLDLGPFYDMLQMDFFWYSHPKITSLKLFIYHPFDLPNGTLPNLSAIRILHVQHSCMVRGRPVTDVDIQELSDEQCTNFLDNLRASTTPITSLAARFAEKSIEAYVKVLANLPHLRSLRITQERMPDKGAEHVNAMVGLASLRELEFIEWAGLRGPDEKGQEHFFRACSKECRSIRRVTFHWWGGHGRTFERKSADDDWAIVHYKQLT